MRLVGRRHEKGHQVEPNWGKERRGGQAGVDVEVCLFL